MVLKDKVVVITGASDGIGQAIAERLVQENCKLAIIGRDEDRLAAVANTTGAKGYICDISDRQAVKDTIERIAADFGTIDVLVNNAGVWQKVSGLEDIDDDAIDAVIDINLKGTINVTKAALRYINQDDKEGIIYNVSSKSGMVAQAGQSVYSATKYGLRGFTDVLREDLKETHVHVGALYQSGINTQMFAKTGEDFPTESFTEPTDLADTVVYALTRPPKMWITETHVDKHV